MRLLMGTAAGLTCLLLVTACASETTDTSGLVEPGFRTVLRVDLRPDTSFDDLSELQEKYRKSNGVESAGGGVGEGVGNALIISLPTRPRMTSQRFVTLFPMSRASSR
jgi:hypothetical protein